MRDTRAARPDACPGYVGSKWGPASCSACQAPLGSEELDTIQRQLRPSGCQVGTSMAFQRNRGATAEHRDEISTICGVPAHQIYTQRSSRIVIVAGIRSKGEAEGHLPCLSKAPGGGGGGGGRLNEEDRREETDLLSRRSFKRAMSRAICSGSISASLSFLHALTRVIAKTLPWTRLR